MVIYVQTECVSRRCRHQSSNIHPAVDQSWSWYYEDQVNYDAVDIPPPGLDTHTRCTTITSCLFFFSCIAKLAPSLTVWI